ncbi:MAG: ATP-binding protein [Actinomycetota bacterium]|nr:ATP-binding protein [Actinomycetota bacterium]
MSIARTYQSRSDPRHNLPAPKSSFVGREGEIAQIKRALETSRLLTLTGAGGSGKTRLALEVARDLLGARGEVIGLAQMAEQGDMRYRLLEPIRKYALKKLEHGGELEEVKRSHSQYFLAGPRCPARLRPQAGRSCA